MKTKTSDALLAAEVSRRGLMKTTAIGGLAMAAALLPYPSRALPKPQTTSTPPAKRSPGAPVR